MMYTVKRGRKPAVQLRVTRNNFKNSFLCFMDIVTCDRGVGRRTPFIRKKGNVTDFCRSPFLVSNYTNSCGLIDGSFFLSGLFKSK